MMRRLWVWPAIGARWTALAVLLAVSASLTYRSTGRAANWTLSLERSLAEWWLWALLTPLVAWLARRFPLDRAWPWRAVAVHLAAGMTIAVLKTAAERAARAWLTYYERSRAREFLLPDTLASIEQQLDPEQFVRIHRCAIVQLDRIVELRPTTHGDVQLTLRSVSLVLSRTWRERVERLCPIR